MKMAISITTSFVLALMISSAHASTTPTGAAEDAATKWFTSIGDGCYSSKENKWGNCNAKDAIDWKLTYDGEDAFAVVTWIPDPTGNAATTEGAYFKKDSSGQFVLVREIKDIAGTVANISLNDGTLVMNMLTFKPTDGRCCPTGSKTTTTQLREPRHKEQGTVASYDMKGLHFGATADEALAVFGKTQHWIHNSQYKYLNLEQTPFIRTIFAGPSDYRYQVMFTGQASGNQMFMWSLHMNLASRMLMWSEITKIFGTPDDVSGEYSVWRIKNGHHEKCPAINDCIPNFALPTNLSFPSARLDQNLDLTQLKAMNFSESDPDIIIVAAANESAAIIQATDVARFKKAATLDIQSIEANASKASESSVPPICFESGVDTSLSGVCPGMSKEVATTILEQKYPNRPDLENYHPVTRESGSMRFEIENSSGYSQSWEISKTFAKADTPPPADSHGAYFDYPERTTLFLAGPAKNQEVIEVQKDFDWTRRPAESPFVAAVKEQFVRRYGQPASHGYLFNGLKSDTRMEWHLRGGKEANCWLDEFGKRFAGGTFETTGFCLAPYGSIYMNDYGTNWLVNLKRAYMKRNTPINGDFKDVGYDLFIALDWDPDYKNPTRMSTMRVRIKDIKRSIEDYAKDMEFLMAAKLKRDGQHTVTVPKL